jgi:hypothetical protein
VQYTCNNNKLAQASAKTSSTQIQLAYEDNLNCLARPGDRVVVIRKPWPIGRWDTVIAFRELNPCYFVSGWPRHLDLSAHSDLRLPAVSQQFVDATVHVARQSRQEFSMPTQCIQ